MKKHSVHECDHCPGETHFPDHTHTLGRLQKIKGQLNGIEKMVKDRRYCVDILTQFKAVSAALNMIERSIFEKHLKNCVKSAMAFRNPKEIDTKVKELLDLFFKRLQ